MNNIVQSTDYTQIPVASLGNSFTTDQYYEEYYNSSQLDNPLSSFTTNYIVNFVTKVLRAFLKVEEATPRQLTTLLKFIIKLHEIERNCNADLNKKIDVVHSVEDEVCFYKKSDKGVSMIAIDNDGDVFYSYIGYQIDSISKRFYFKDISSDMEEIIYNFLSK